MRQIELIVVTFVRNYRLNNHAISPSVREIGAGCNIHSTSAVMHIIRSLESKKFIGRIGIMRAIYLVDGSDIPCG